MFHDDPRVLGWDVWNEPDNPARDYRKVENQDKLELVKGVLPHVFRWGCAVNPVQPLTSGVWQGHWKDAGSRSAIAGLQLETLGHHQLSQLRRSRRVRGPHRRTHAGWVDRYSAPSIWPETWAAPWREFFRSPRGAMSTPSLGGSLPGGRRRICRGIPGRSPTLSLPETWFSNLIHPDGRAHDDNEIRVIQKLAGIRNADLFFFFFLKNNTRRPVRKPRATATRPRHITMTRR